MYLKKTFHNWKSWVYAWLFLSIAAIASPTENPSGVVTRLIKDSYLSLNDAITTTGIALTIGSDNNIYALYDAPLRIIIWHSDQTTNHEFDISSGISSTPTDLTTDGGLGLLMVDPWDNNILHFDRMLQQKPSVIPKLDDQRFEPLSICRSVDGTIFVINQADDDLWKIDRDGLPVPFGWSPSRSGKLSNPKRIRYNAQIDKFVILDDNCFVLAAPSGGHSFRIPLRLEASSGIALSKREIWVVGDGVECISISSKSESYYAPSDSLKSWGVFPAIDVAIDDNDFLYILSGFDGNILKLKVLRASSEHP